MQSTLIIAEAGVNHNGDMALAYKLIDAASNARADVVKFQSFKAEDLVSMSAPKAKYQAINTGKNDGQFQMLKSLELNVSNLKKLVKYAQKKGVICISTPFSESVASEIGSFMPFWKVPSGEITNYPFLKYLSTFKKPIVLSTGMSSLGEVEKAIEIIYEGWQAKFPSSIQINKYTMAPLTILHCVSNYPAPMESVNLNTIKTLKHAFKIPVGFSDHTLGIEIPIGAVAIGASVIEKHFTLDKDMEGPDHKASLLPQELKKMINSIRNIELAMGNGIKQIHSSETNTQLIARKSIHLKRGILKGNKIQLSDLILKRPGNGLAADFIPIIIGKKVKKKLFADQILLFKDIE
jgi:N-acetylneuraminate synthase